ncbi:DUF6461 domain-containing protein [Streptomyces lavendulae]|uniref:DUF6461 domain-containing protein n=1 Tax=Streptomyces lavendulae TaxID=1914 RepID=UPI0036C0F7D0
MALIGLVSASRDGDPGVDSEAAVLALAERLKGVGVTEKLLAEAEYQGESRRGSRQGVRESVTTHVTERAR